MTLRAEAAVFTMPASDADKSGYTEEAACSTVAPSPALTGCASPMLSPYWGFEDCSQEAMWAAAAMYGGYMPEGYPDEFSLPEHYQPDDGSAAAEAEAEEYKFGRPRAMTMPAYIDEFTLEGIEDLQSSLAGFLKHADAAPADGESPQDNGSQGSTSAGPVSPPPGLAPPPGLKAPPGLEDGPPGLEATTTVADLHTREKRRERTATWSHPTAKTSPLPFGSTTAMLRNIPNKYTRDGLVERLHEAGYRGELDFIYLPIDFKNKCGVGYAFLNFRTPEACARFGGEYHLCNSRDKLPGYNSKKVCEVSAARFQGCDENVRRLQASSVMAELIANPEWLPKLLDENGEDVDFPLTDMSNEAAQSRSARGRLQRRKGSM